jgi:hypothetical protein
MRLGRTATRVVGVVNGGVAALATSPRWGRLFGRLFVVVTYTGRRSGRTFSTPVAYRRKGDEITIGVQFANAKSWWRNFQGAGGPLSLRLHGVDRSGHAVARRSRGNNAVVTVRLDPPDRQD